MASSCFVCAQCGALDVALHVVLDRPCPQCGAPADSMGLVQCRECGDPCVPAWSKGVAACPDRWVHAVDKRDCSYSALLHDLPVIVPVVPLVGMPLVYRWSEGPREPVQLRSSRIDSISLLFGRPSISFVHKSMHGKLDLVANHRGDPGAGDGFWIRGRSKNSRWGLVVLYPGPPPKGASDVVERNR